ncbi:MAG: class F sortase [Dehalococcoidia bacterium]
MKFRPASHANSDRLSRLSIIVMALGIVALMASGVLFGLSATGIIGNSEGSGPGTATAFGNFTPEPSTPAPLVPTPDTSPLVRLVIPKAKVDANVVQLGLDENGVMQSPGNAYDVAWYDFSAKPGAGGNAVFSGHVDYHNVGAAVFWNLRDLLPGDIIEVHLADGTVYQYSVDALECIPVDGAPINQIVGPTSSEVVTLITCCGTFNSSTRQYDKRLIVRGNRLVDATPTPVPLQTVQPPAS